MRQQVTIIQTLLNRSNWHVLSLPSGISLLSQGAQTQGLGSRGAPEKRSREIPGGNQQRPLSDLPGHSF